MKEYRHYACDFGHHWTLFVDESEIEKDEDGLCSECPERHEAVMLKRNPVIDDVQITIRPASRIGDKVTNHVVLRGKYYIIISDISNTWERVSEKVYSWNDTIEIIKNFDKRSTDWALKYWDRKKF